MFTFDAARHTVVRNLQIKHGGNQRITFLTGFTQHDAAYGHRANGDITACVVRKMAVFNTTEIREAHLRGFDGGRVVFHDR